MQADGSSPRLNLEQINPASPDPGRHLTTGSDADFGRQKGTQGPVSELFGSTTSVPCRSHTASCAAAPAPCCLPTDKLRPGLACFAHGLRVMPGQEGAMFQLRLAEPTKTLHLLQSQVMAAALEQPQITWGSHSVSDLAILSQGLPSLILECCI